MLKILLIPDLEHCIETVAKKEYEETVKQLLVSREGNQNLCEKVEILTTFLQLTDFKKLRADSEKYLVQGSQIKFIVFMKGKILKYEMQVQVKH